MTNTLKLVVSIVSTEAAGLIGSIFTSSSIPTWYKTLNKPSFNPPNWLFGPVWTTLYLMMGVAFYRIWKKGLDVPGVKFAMILFGVHLAFNILWSVLFFGLKNPALAFAEIIVLWLMIVACIYKFYQLDRTAAYLLVPYLLWVSFASLLNFSLWRLNS
jgi:tryptophan-rich sensory protein